MGDAVFNRIIYGESEFAAPAKYKSRFPEKGGGFFDD